MSTKTISVRLEAYERLARARKTPSESFSDVIMRARWDAQPSTAGESLRVVRERGPAYRVDELAEIEDRKRDDRPPPAHGQVDPGLILERVPGVRVLGY
jgi:hypothetical protein